MTHGRTRIKLYNPISGNIAKDVVSENTFQGSVISEGLRNLGYGKASFYNDTNPDLANPPFTEIVGGILLFDTRIDDNPQFPPLGVSMVGNGAYGIVNQAEPSELGSYDDNSSQIFISEKKIKMVYQYSRSQANGQIASVCLTSRTGGFIGVGNSISNVDVGDANKWSVERNGAGADICPQSDLSTYKNTYNKVVCNGYQYSFSISGTDLTIVKFKVPLKNASLLDCIPQTIVKSVADKQYTFMGSSFIVSAYNKKIYISPYGYKGAGNYYLWVLDTETDNLTQEVFNFGVATRGVSVSQGKIFVPSYGTNRFEIFNLDGTPFDTIEYGDGFVQSDYGGYDLFIGDFGNHSLVHIRTSDYVGHNFLYDSVLQKATITNMKDNAYNRTQGLRTEETSKALIETFYAGAASYNGSKAFNNPLYLATINNLQTPVNKTLELNMTVEYTLTES